LLVGLCKKAKLLETKRKYTLDYDGHIVENTKKDSCPTYKRTSGYYPVVCSINKLPVFLQNRKGNTPESYHQLQVIQNTLTNLKEANIEVGKFRADTSCYEKETIEYLENNNITYYIRAEQNETIRIAFEDENEWIPAELNNRQVETCSMQEKILGQWRRIVAYRVELPKGNSDLFDKEGYRYHAIITSDTETEPIDIIQLYNQRGCDGEHHFKELDYDFSWNKLPFDNFAMNTIYFYATALCYILFWFCKQAYAGKLSFVRPTMRLKSFILHFVTLTAKWIHTGRQWILNIYTHKNYTPILAPP